MSNLVLGAIYILGAIGYVLNIVSIFTQATFWNVLGVFVPLLGAILGLFA